MKKLRILILIFFLGVLIPLTYLVLQTYRSLEQDEFGELHYFAETLFNAMEGELSFVVMREERRAIDDYNNSQTSQSRDMSGKGRSSISSFPNDTYILGFLQNNPDGSFQTPLGSIEKNLPQNQADLLVQLKKLNDKLNQKWPAIVESNEAHNSQILVRNEKIDTSKYAEKYLRLSRFKDQQNRLINNKRRNEYIHLNQILNIAQMDQKIALAKSLQANPRKNNRTVLNELINKKLSESGLKNEYTYASIYKRDNAHDAAIDRDAGKLLVQVDPIESIFIDENCVFIYRRIIINNSVYRQGVIIMIHEFLQHLITAYFDGQPMAEFAKLRLNVNDGQKKITEIQAGVSVDKSIFSLAHKFSSPFSFLNADITCENIPRSSARRTLEIMTITLGFVLLMGLFSIYKSAETVVDLSERRSSFVSSVTHELKTPLTTIRMYIEMLEQGIARDHDREQEYFRILGSESSRLSRLINNVLEFSKLEKKQRNFILKEGLIDDVIHEVVEIMHEKIEHDGFKLKTELEYNRPFKHDHEAMIQVFINLIENSIKFGRNSSSREITISVKPEGKYVNISVSDTGPGIPRNELKKIFNNFYRVDNENTRNTSGTGIGLALVKNFIKAMGGSITATNNDGPGCTIAILLPA